MKARTIAVRAMAGIVAVALAVVVVPGAAADTQVSLGKRARMQQLLDTVRAQNSAPGVGLTYGDGDHDVTMSSGSRNAVTLHPIESADKVRVGSDTKMFVAAVVLQLVDEGRLVLDAPLDDYLPGALRYAPGTVAGDPAAYDGRTVTLRQLLQHTSGIPDYGADLTYVLDPRHQLVPPTPQDLVAFAVRSGPTHAPGAAWGYSNTDYTLLGMMVQAVTGRSLSTEIAERIATPLGLRNTFFAESGQRRIRGSQVRGYLSGPVPVDMTNFEPAVWGAAGALVSSPDDMNTFMSALLAGRVLSPARLHEMEATVPMNDGFGNGYGLGIVGRPLACGTAWGHAGFLAGYQTFGLARANGEHAFFTMNTSISLNVLNPPNPVLIYELMDLALC
jgi:D-alanyl-D-alanine carboxypeptidase